MDGHDNLPGMCPADIGPPATLAEAFERARALDAPLGRQLAQLALGFRQVRPDAMAAYDDLIGRLEVVKLGHAGPQVGEPMPEFVLPDQGGRLVGLEALLEAGPLVVSFNRGHWCEFCRLEIRALAAANERIRRLGAAIVSIVPERSEFAKRFRRDSALQFPLLSDIDLGYALTVGLVMWVGEEVGRIYRQAGIDLALYQGNGGGFLPVPATFVIARNGLIAARYVDPDFRRRMAVEDIVAALAALRVSEQQP